MIHRRTFFGFALKIGLTVVAPAVAAADIQSGLIAYYPFNGSAADATCNGHDGTVDGAVLAPDRCGVAESAYEKDGPDHFLVVAARPAMRLSGTAFKGSGWANEEV